MSEVNRRQHARRPVTYALEICSETVEGSKLTTTGHLHDISDSGISFVSSRAELFQIGQKIEISLLGNYTLHAAGEIMWLEASQFEVNQALIGLRLEALIESESMI